MSFYALRCLHVLIESYLDEIQPPPPRELLAYLFFLPTIVAGPVHRYPPFAAQEPPSIDGPRVSEALERILYGYAKIVVISNYLLSAKLFPALKQQVAASSAAYQYLDCLDFGLNLYFQFSGYSDIAIAFALLLGRTVMENFDWPLLRTNLVDFWRTWHISVTSWCRHYVFTGVYAASRQRWLGMVATMLAIGLWHGLTLNFVAWGLYHGLGIVATQLWSATVLRHRQFSGPANLALSGRRLVRDFQLRDHRLRLDQGARPGLVARRSAPLAHRDAQLTMYSLLSRYTPPWLATLLTGVWLAAVVWAIFFTNHRRGGQLPLLADVSQCPCPGHDQLDANPALWRTQPDGRRLRGDVRARRADDCRRREGLRARPAAARSPPADRTGRADARRSGKSAAWPAPSARSAGASWWRRRWPPASTSTGRWSTRPR